MSDATTSERISFWHRLLEQRLNRRKFGATALAAGAAVSLPLELRTAAAAEAHGVLPAPHAAGPVDARLPFRPISPTTADDVVLPPGYRYDLIAHYGHDLGQGLVFGYNADFTAFFPIDMLEKGVELEAPHRGFMRRDLSSTDGLLLVNHEYINPMFVSQYGGSGPKSEGQLALEQDAVGMSIIRVRRSGGRWSFDQGDSIYNRRLTARTPMVLTGPAAGIDGGPNVVGTLGNCSGGMTPWGTALSCEENFQDYPTPASGNFSYGWDPAIYGRRHYGWVVEVDPFDKHSTPRKHTAMGRFRHENVAIRVGGDGTVVAYMGDDKSDCCIYKFVADRKLTDPGHRGYNMGILESGKLYAADFANGRWLLLDYDAQARLRELKNSSGAPVYRSQADVLADTAPGAVAIGATPMDRPEDLEINPLDGSVFVALTNNTGHGNFHGQIVRLEESGDNPAAETFSWSIFAVGGPQSGFSSPDNLIFDDAGNLWMVTDISSSRTTKGIYAFQGNNALFFFRTSGPYAGIAYQFASGPNQCELTGPMWTPDGQTLFLSVQHPGEESPSLTQLTSHWPLGGDSWPRPGVVAITGFPKQRR